MRAPSIFTCLPGLAPHFLSQSTEKDHFLGGLSQKPLPPPPPFVKVLPSKIEFVNRRHQGREQALADSQTGVLARSHQRRADHDRFGHPVYPSSRRSLCSSQRSVCASLGAFNSSFTLDMLPSTRFARDAAAIANTQIDWKETDNAHIFKVDLPGLKKEEVKIEVEDGRIRQISGERSKEEEKKSEKYHRVERSHGKFLRRFRLPENAKVEEVKAGMENGLLTVTVPKQPEPKPNVKSIEISG